MYNHDSLQLLDIHATQEAFSPILPHILLETYGFGGTAL